MKWVLIGLAILALAVVPGAFVLSPVLHQRLLEPPEDAAGQDLVLVEVKQGAPAASVVRDLVQAGLIRNERAFKLMLRQNEWEGKLQPGLYRVEPGLHAEEIARLMVEHKTWNIRVTIPEGLTLEQTAERIETAGQVEEGQWLPAAGDILTAATADLVREITGHEPPTGTAEGYLFPATYMLPAGATAERVVRRMVTEFHRRLTGPHTEEVRRHALSLHELVTLASIIEREAGVDRERPKVARVFLNRLDIGMKLESCATVQYALPEHKPRLLFRDLRVQSPYNTYLHTGLPPGPICSPGEASLLAALRPGETDALYFVSRGDGTHQFSRTLAEHNEAIRRIRGG